MDDDARVTTAIVVLLIAFCAVLLAKWLAVVALAGLLLVVVLRRVIHAVRGRRALDEAAVVAPDPGPVTGPQRVVVPMPDCSWCGLVGGHRDLRGDPVRPRLAHAMPAPARHAS